ncbi:hypothetical protein HA466_0116550 [Hirschfeldia incana]|nr:hypothetical protein HA466_0116550 [Hirschfeldia incana]
MIPQQWTPPWRVFCKKGCDADTHGKIVSIYFCCCCFTGSNSAAAVSVADPFFNLSSSSGEMGRSMSKKEGAAFSESQWQELERQRNIYKYMMASLPVPSELLTQS